MKMNHVCCVVVAIATSGTALGQMGPFAELGASFVSAPGLFAVDYPPAGLKLEEMAPEPGYGFSGSLGYGFQQDSSAVCFGVGLRAARRLYRWSIVASDGFTSPSYNEQNRYEAVVTTSQWKFSIPVQFSGKVARSTWFAFVLEPGVRLWTTGAAKGELVTTGIHTPPPDYEVQSITTSRSGFRSRLEPNNKLRPSLAIGGGVRQEVTDFLQLGLNACIPLELMSTGLDGGTPFEATIALTWAFRSQANPALPHAH